MERPRLTRLLAAASDAPLTLVDAPLGYGKTVAVRDLLRSTGVPAAVVELEPGDDDVRRFWDKVVGRVAERWPDLGLGAAAAGAREVVPLLHTRAAGRERPLLVVLEDLHVLRDAAVLGELTYLVDRLPPELRILATTRRLPALPVGRWRAQGQMTEITMDDLRFRPDEVTALLGGDPAGAAGVGAAGSAGSAADGDGGPADASGRLRALTQRSEGWVAGLQLLAGLPDAGGPLDPAAAEDLLAAVLAGQPADVEDFLLSTAILGRFTADLCRVVTGRHDAGIVLHDLQAANLFVVPLDDEQDWFRYQRLFGELLRLRLDARTASVRHLDRQRALHRVAAAWFEADAKPADAVAHHVRAGDGDRAFTLLNGDVDVFARGPRVQGIDWEGLFPAAWLQEDAHRMIWFAALLAPSGGFDRMSLWLDRAEAALADAPAADGRRGLLAAVQTYWYGIQYDAPRTIERGRQALALLDDPVVAEVMGRRVLVSMLVAHILVDDIEGAEQICARLDEPGVPEIVRSLAVPGFRSRLALRKGQLAQAEAMARLVRRAASSMEMPQHLGMRDANLALGGVLAERGEVEAAAELFDDAIEVAERRRWVASAAVTAVERIRLEAAVHGPAAGMVAVDELRRAMTGHPVGPDAGQTIDMLEATLELTSGTPGALDRAAALVAGLRPGLRRRLLEVRLALARGDLARAAMLLTPVTPANLRDRLVVDLLAARLAALTGDHETRDRRLRTAADRARAQGFRQIFLDEAPELLPALHHLADRHTELRPLADEIATLAAGSGPGLADSVTERERSVLRLLQSRLTHHEIARQLGISDNTLKTHTRSLYRKLGATSRAEAITAALRAGLV
ncbi:MAG TPA: LuxR C-terminal-related transcriptional regulator [Acidimicrobiales bacterium]|nr:LuxR C-terminal-related transcriptional regulator [Acidimicrobiales bacterium]